MDGFNSIKPTHFLGFSGQVELGEGILCSGQNLYWIDIYGGRLYWMDLNQGSESLQHHDFGEFIGTVAVTNSEELVVALKSGIKLFNPTSRKITKTLCHPEKDREALGFRYNDGKPGPDGRFYVGSMLNDHKERDKKPGVGKLWCIDPDGSYKVVLENIDVPNGLVWKEKSKTEADFYYIDSAARNVRRFRQDLTTGQLSNPEVVVTFDEGYPDGMCISENGLLFVAMWEGHCVAVCDPEKRAIVGRIELPLPQATSCTFWESKLVINTAREYFDDARKQQYPQAGDLFIADLASVSIAGNSPYNFG